jgi:hypothetical protein
VHLGLVARDAQPEQPTQDAAGGSTGRCADQVQQRVRP